MYRVGMETLTAQEQLMNLRISCAPHMKKQSLEKFKTDLMRVANPVEPMAMTHEMMAQVLNG